MSEPPSPKRICRPTPTASCRRSAAPPSRRGSPRTPTTPSASRATASSPRSCARSYDGVLDEPVPERLQRAVRAGRVRRVALVAGWVALGVALGAIAGWQLHGAQPAPAGRRRRRRGDGAPRGGRARDVLAGSPPPGRSRRRSGSASGRVALQAPRHAVARAEARGGRLQPGRRPPAAGRQGPVAHFMYQCNRGTRVTLYVRSDMGRNRSTAFRYAREGTVGVFYWVDSKLGYARVLGRHQQGRSAERRQRRLPAAQSTVTARPPCAAGRSRWRMKARVSALQAFAMCSSAWRLSASASDAKQSRGTTSLKSRM